MDSTVNSLRVVEATRTSVLSYAAQDWPLIKNTNGIQISAHKESSAPAKIYKAECLLNASPAKVFEHVAIIPGASVSASRKKIQKSIKSWEVIEEIEQNIFVLRSVSNSTGGGIISSRDYLDLVANFTDFEGGMYISCATGIEYPYPEDAKCVRGWNYPSGMMCFPVEGKPDVCRFVYIIHTDLKGKIPTKLIDMALPSLQANFLTNLTKAINEEK